MSNPEEAPVNQPEITENVEQQEQQQSAESDSDALENSEEVSTYYTDEEEDADEDLRSRLEALEQQERELQQQYITIFPEDYGYDHITIEERYNFFADLGIVDKPSQFVHHYFNAAILQQIGDKQWFALWEAKIPINDTIIRFPCIVKVNGLEEGLMADCSFHSAYDLNDTYYYSGNDAIQKEYEIKYYLKENTIPFMQLHCPVFYSTAATLDDEITRVHCDDLIVISILMDYCRFWYTVVYREWDQEASPQRSSHSFQADLINRLNFYQNLSDGTMSIPQLEEYNKYWRCYDECVAALEQLDQEPESYQREMEYEYWNLQRCKFVKLIEFYDSTELRKGITTSKPLNLNRSRYSRKSHIHLVNGMPTFNVNEMKYATVNCDTDTTEVMHHESVYNALEHSYQNDVVSVMAGEYEVSDINFEQSCAIRGLPWRLETQQKQEDEVDSKDEVEEAKPTTNAEKSACEKLIGFDADRDIMMLGGFKVSANQIVFDQLHFRCEDYEKIVISGEHVRFNNCTFILDYGLIEVMSGSHCTFTDCIISSENQVGIVQKIGSNVTCVGCHLRSRIEVETFPVYAPELTECTYGDIRSVDVCNSTEHNVNIVSVHAEEGKEEEAKNVEMSVKDTEPKIDEQAGGERVQVTEKVQQIEPSGNGEVPIVA